MITVHDREMSDTYVILLVLVDVYDTSIWFQLAISHVSLLLGNRSVVPVGYDNQVEAGIFKSQQFWIHGQSSQKRVGGSTQRDTFSYTLRAKEMACAHWPIVAILRTDWSRAQATPSSHFP